MIRTDTNLHAKLCSKRQLLVTLAANAQRNTLAKARLDAARQRDQQHQALKMTSKIHALCAWTTKMTNRQFGGKHAATTVPTIKFDQNEEITIFGFGFVSTSNFSKKNHFLSSTIKFDRCQIRNDTLRCISHHVRARAVVCTRLCVHSHCF